MEGKVTEFLRHKWRQVHRFLDTNKDGLLTEEDFKSFADNLSKMTNSTPEQAAVNLEAWLKWFRRLQPDPSVKIDEHRLQELHEKLYTTNLQNYRQFVKETANVIFDRIDFDGDGIISWKEFSIFYESVGITSLKLAQRNFSMIDKDGDGKIQREEYLEELLRHFADPDPITGVTHFFDIEEIN